MPYRRRHHAVSGQASKPQVWFLDTSALVTMAVHSPLGDDMRTSLGTDGVWLVLLQVVVGDLEGLLRADGREARWAARALKELDWLGDPVGLDDHGMSLAVELQEEIRGVRPLRHPMEHWGGGSDPGACHSGQGLYTGAAK
jgi:hypothetical protein